MFRIAKAVFKHQNKSFLKNYLNNSKNQFFGRKFSNTSLSYVAARNYCTTNTIQHKENENQNRIYSSNILDALNKSNQDEGLVLLQCCGQAILNEGNVSRIALIEKVWTKLLSSNNLSVDYYNTYLQTCKENRKDVDFLSFIKEMKCEPNQATYRLLLDCSCECGNLEQAMSIIEEMKSKKLAADEGLFNSLILGHAVKGGLSDVKSVFDTMRRAHIPVTSATYLNLLRGLIVHNHYEEFLEALDKYPIAVHNDKILQLLQVLALNDNHTWLDKLLEKFGDMKLSKDNLEQLKLICIGLVHLNKYDAAMFFYRRFVEFNPLDRHYGFFLLEEMLFSEAPTQKIIKIAQDLKALNENILALEHITGIALSNNLESAWTLLDAMPNLRPHYFWPLLVDAGCKKGEQGIFETVKKMLEYDVKINAETLEFYCLPFCDTANSDSLLIRFSNLGLPLREIFTPFLSFLLRRKDVEDALKLCKNGDSPAQVDKLIQPLFKAWIGTKNNENIVLILKKICKSNSYSSDHIGQFLIKVLRYCRTPENHRDFLNLLKTMHKCRMYISSSMADSLLQILKQSTHQCNVTPQIEEYVDNLVNASINEPQGPILHPRNMSIEELECHLIELQNKNMETRGVLRRLIQNHCNLGNEKRANELREQFLNAGYHETSGMKSSLLFASILNNNATDALKIYKELKETNPTFLFDEFKVIDLATLLVTNNQFETAMSILTKETANRKVKGGKTLIRNCWKLISASTTEEQITKLFNFLLEKRYCEVSNIILGPLVKFHLNRNDLVNAVAVYSKCTEEHKCTPLQLELLCAIIEDENKELLQQVLDVTSKIHGLESTTISFIAALAQTGNEKLLTKYLIDTKVVHKGELGKRCERWVRENKLAALETLAQSIIKISHPIIEVSYIHFCIMKLHSNNNNCDSAVQFYRQLLEKETIVSQNTVDELLKLVNRCKYKMPELLIKTKVG